ncbi:lipoprotein [Methylophilus sp.]|uniref:LPS translocon maturation chaperone LptM n=1 Tax=Methylophilus sp. TaxID=29541 RepID=UPI00338E01F7
MSDCRFNGKMALNLHWTVNMFSFYTRLLAVALLSAQLSACGLKGDLYIPERQYPQTPQQDKSSS